jgi:hypothetical protein
MKTNDFNIVVSTAQSINLAVLAGDDRWGFTLKAIRGFGKDAQRANRGNIALALFQASTSVNADAIMTKAWARAETAADAAYNNSFLLAAMNALPNMRVEPVSTLVVPVGEAKTFTAVHSLGDLLTLLDTDNELLEALLKQGANRNKAKGLGAAAEFAASNREVMKHFADNLAFLGKFAKAEHSVTINARKFNQYALAQFEAVKDAASGLEVNGSQLAQGLCAIAQFAADQAVDHAGLAEDTGPDAIRFWVAEGGFFDSQVGAEGGYANAPDTMIRMPFYETRNIGQNPSQKEMLEAVSDAFTETERVGEEFMTFAKHLDALIGEHATYRLRDRTQGELTEVIDMAKARLEDRRATQKAKMEAQAMASMRDKMEALDAAMDGLNAAQKAQVKKMAQGVMEGLKAAQIVAKTRVAK